MTGHKTRSVFERYNIVSAGDLREAAKRLDAATGTTGLHIFVVRTDERERYARAQRLKAMERMKTQLDARCSI